MTASLRFGAQLHREGATFRLWAPAAKRVELILDRSHPMQAEPEGWYEVTIPGTRGGTLYKYRIDGELVVPDPASHFQPHDVSGPSEVIEIRPARELVAARRRGSHAARQSVA